MPLTLSRSAVGAARRGFVHEYAAVAARDLHDHSRDLPHRAASDRRRRVRSLKCPQLSLNPGAPTLPRLPARRDRRGDRIGNGTGVLDEESVGAPRRILGFRDFQHPLSDHAWRVEVEQEERRALVPFPCRAPKQMRLLPDREDSEIRQNEEPLAGPPDVENPLAIEWDDGLTCGLADLVWARHLVRRGAKGVRVHVRSQGEVSSP
jgi:hypothetical protein